MKNRTRYFLKASFVRNIECKRSVEYCPFSYTSAVTVAKLISWGSKIILTRAFGKENKTFQNPIPRALCQAHSQAFYKIINVIYKYLHIMFTPWFNHTALSGSNYISICHRGIVIHALWLGTECWSEEQKL